MSDLRDFRRDPFAFWLKTGARGPVVKIRFGPLVRHVVNDPQVAQHVLQHNHKNYIKDQRLVRALEDGSGRVLVTSDGPEWLWRRRLMQPAFHRRQIAHFGDAIVAHTHRHLARWQPGDIVNVAEDMNVLTMKIIGETMLGADFAGDSATLHHAYVELGRTLIARVEKLFRWPLWVPTPQNRAFLRATATIGAAMRAILELRRNNPQPRRDLLEMLLAARLDDSDHRFTEDQLIYEMSAIVFAGHETTATALTWTLHLLSQHPDVAARVRAELHNVLAGRNPTMEDIDQLTYLGQVINEAMRCYPPLYVISRQSIAADRLGGYELPAEGRTLIHVLGIHRNPNYWDEPDRFDPQRFDQQRIAGQHRFAFMPFLDGPRKCIGGPLALAELHLILAMILQRFELRTVNGDQVTPEAAVTLRPRGGLPMLVSARE